ncbi:MAG: glycosyltransferase family 4 protein [Nitrospiraceae bacterium]
MRVGIDCQALGMGVRHGFSTYLSNLIKALGQRYSSSEFLEWPCRYHRGWRIPHQLWWDQGQIPWRAFSEKVDVIHAPAFSGAVCRTQPLVLTVHDLMYTRHPEWLPTQRARWYWSEWIPFTARHASAVIVPSQASKQDLIELGGVLAERITVVPEAVDPLFARQPTADEVRAYRNRKELQAPYVLYVGAIDRRKDWRGLLQAFRRTRERFKDLQLVIAGVISPGRSPLPEELRASGLGNEVVLQGYVPDQELPLLYAGAALFVFPSWWEGFGLPPLEAMAMGVPVIAYRTSSLPEVMGKAGVLIDAPHDVTALSESMMHILSDQRLRDELVANQLQQAATFSWERAADQTMAVYEQCAKIAA